MWWRNVLSEGFPVGKSLDEPFSMLFYRCFVELVHCLGRFCFEKDPYPYSRVPPHPRSLQRRASCNPSRQLRACEGLAEL